MEETHDETTSGSSTIAAGSTITASFRVAETMNLDEARELIRANAPTVFSLEDVSYSEQPETASPEQ